MTINAPEACQVNLNMRPRASILLLFTLLLITGCSPHVYLNAPFNSRPPNHYEEFYTALAAESGDPKLCDKISKRTLKEDGPNFGTNDYFVYTVRSQCYFYAAIRTKNEALCDSVTRIVTLPVNKSEYTAAECREIVRKNERLQYYPFVNVSGSLMKEMGFREEEAFDAAYARNPMGSAVYHFYYEVRDISLLNKVKELPTHNEQYSPSGLRSTANDEILTQMVAVEEGLPGLCEKISPEQPTSWRSVCFA